MSYTYPHYASQSPVASYQSAATITHFMEQVAGRQQATVDRPTPEDEEAQDQSSPIVSPGTSRPINGYGAISTRGRRRSSAASMPINTLAWTINASETAPLLSANPVKNSATAFDPPDESIVADGDWPPDGILEGISGSGSETPDSDTLDSEDFGHDSDQSWTRRLKEAKIVTRYAIPILVYYPTPGVLSPHRHANPLIPPRSSMKLMWTSLSSIASVVSIGHLSTIELAASTLGSMTASVTGYSIVVGMVSALDSLLPQAWGSVGDQKRLVGLWSLRMTVVIAVTLVPIVLVWHASEDILLLLKQDPKVAELASLYLRWMSLSLPAYCFNYIVRKYYQSIGLLNIPSFVILVVAPLNVVLNYILVWGPGPLKRFGLGFVGAPIATSISFNLISMFYLIHLLVYSPPEPWFKLRHRKDVAKVFSGEALGFLVRLGLAGVGQTASEWWSWELVGLAASLLGPTTLASQSVLLVSASTSYQLSFAISAGGSVRIGNLLGAGHAVQAEVSSHMSFLLIVLVSCLNSTIFLIFRHKWAYLFNNDTEVVALVAKVLPLVALFQVLDGLGAMIGAILRVTGRQFTGAILNLTGYYVVGIPLGLILTFYFPQWELGLLGLWIGLSFALIYTAVFGLWYCYRTDWNGEVEKVRIRLKAGGRVEHSGH
ncbi:hypothetical protein FRB97_006099 [Tulasnella sp. 331]|nr:hypothetical protein FRB97_006099 [Tulasnella sp. 331]